MENLPILNFFPDDLQELAAVLQTTATSTYPTSSTASVYSTPAMMNTPVPAGVGVQGNLHT